MTISNRKTLPIQKILVAALWISYEQRWLLARRLALPIAALTLISVIFGLAGAQPENTGWNTNQLLYWAMHWMFFPLLAIPCHRMVLLGPDSIGDSFHGFWARRETRFSVWLIIFSVTMGILMMALLMLFGVLVAVFSPDDAITVSYMVSYVGPISAIAATSYIYSRLALVFPSIAVDKQLTVHEAWQMSMGNGWRLFAIVAVLPVALKWGVVYLEHSVGAILAVPLTVVYYAFIAIAVIALSLSYARLN